MICDAVGPVGVGGIMGGLETEIDDHTTNVLIEAANFNFINIRKTTQQMKLAQRGRFALRARHPSGHGAARQHPIGQPDSAAGGRHDRHRHRR